MRERSITGISAGLGAFFAFFFLIGWYYSGAHDVVPVPGLIATGVVVGILFWNASRLRRRLAPMRTEDLGDRRCSLEGRVRALGTKLVSPYSGRECVAWLGWSACGGEKDVEVLARSVPFSIEPSDGGRAVVIHLANGYGATSRAWNHLAHGEQAVPPDWATGEEDHRRALEFEIPARIEAARAVSDTQSVESLSRPIEEFEGPRVHTQRELTYEDGEIVVLEGRFRRVSDTLGLRSVDGIPTYEVVDRVIFAKDTATFHGSCASPLARALWPAWVLVGVAVETVALIVLALLSYGL